MIKRYKRYLNYITNNRKHIFGLRITVTWRCDSKCVTCNIWNIKSDSSNELQVKDYDQLTKSKHLRSTEYITISGGEPTLRQDLADIITVMHHNIPSAMFNITTNCTNPTRTERLFKEVLEKNPGIKFGTVGLSLNGPREIHDRTRGVPGNFDNVTETYHRIKDLVPCSFSFTFCKDNVDYFDWVQDYARNLKTTAYICWTVMNERFKVTEKDLVFWQPELVEKLYNYSKRYFMYSNTPLGIIKNLLLLPTGLVKSYFYDNVINKEIMPCYAGGQIVHIDPIGNVYPCNFKLTNDRILGNLKVNSFDNMWNVNPKSILEEIKKGICMYPNGLCGDSDIYPSVANHPISIIKWYIKKLLRKERLVHKRSQ